MLTRYKILFTVYIYDRYCFILDSLLVAALEILILLMQLNFNFQCYAKLRKLAKTANKNNFFLKRTCNVARYFIDHNTSSTTYGGLLRAASNVRHRYSPIMPMPSIWKADTKRNTTIIVVHPCSEISPVSFATITKIP